MNKEVKSVIVGRGRGRRRLAYLAAAAALVTAALSACSAGSAGSTDASTGKSQASETIRVAYAQGLQANFYHAMQNGTFKKYGVNVQGTKFDSGPALVSALVAGSADVGYFGVPAMATANQNGAGLQIFDIANDAGAMTALYVNKDAGIHSLKDLKGKTIATSQNTTGHITLLLALKAAGLKPSDVNIQFLDPAGIVAGFTRGDIKAVYHFASVGAKLMSAGATIVKGSSSTDLGADDTGNFLAKKSYIDAHKDALKRFAEAVDADTPKVNNDKAAFVTALDQGIGLAAGQAEIIYKNQPSPCLSGKDLASSGNRLSLAPNGGFTKVASKMTAIMVDLGILKAAPKVSDFITDTVVKELQ